MSRQTFRIGLFGCFNAADCGVECFCAHCFCGPCVWSNAMRSVGIEGTEKVLAAVLVAGVTSDNTKDGRPANNLVSDAANIVAALGGAEIRRKLHMVLYATPLQEGTLQTYCSHACCRPCAYVQEVDAVMTYAAEERGTPLEYTFPWCADLRFSSGKVPAFQELVPGSDAASVGVPLFMKRG